MRLKPYYRFVSPTAYCAHAASRRREQTTGDPPMLTDTPTWFITGASSGYGLALARYAIDRGYNVIATARSVAKLATLAALAPDRVLVQKLDVTLPHDAATPVEAAVTRFGPTDVLINNASYGLIAPLEHTPE